MMNILTRTSAVTAGLFAFERSVLVSFLPTNYHNTYLHLCGSPNLNKNSKIDRSRYPALNEDELDEKFVKGSGPGGQNVNKRANCVQLMHVPTGLQVRVHEHRMLQENRKLARKLLTEKLDEHLNGDLSVSSQKKALETKRKAKMEYKKRRARRLKQEGANESEGDEEEYYDPKVHT